RSSPPGWRPRAARARAPGAGRRRSLLLALEVGDEVLGGAGHHLDELPAVGAPLVEDGLGVVDEQWNGRVLPGLHAAILGLADLGQDARRPVGPELGDDLVVLVLEPLCPGLHLRVAAQQRPALPLSQPTPHA